MKPSARRRFQFRLRTLFVVVTIVAVQCAVCLPAYREWQRVHLARPRTFIVWKGGQGVRYTIRNVQFTKPATYP